VSAGPRAHTTRVDNDKGASAPSADQNSGAEPCRHPRATCCQVPPTNNGDLRTPTHSRAVSVTSDHDPAGSRRPSDVVDVVDSSTVATLGGTQNFFSNIGSALSPIVVGAFYGATGSFEVPLLPTGLVVIAGAFCFGFLIKRVEPIRRT
jgi:hypothetical protein